jgi:cytochrome c biogenesis protein ResB
MAATLVPQSSDSLQKVSAWVVVHPLFEPTARALGLHHAFTSWPFAAGILLLALSTALCAWRRTKAAIARSRVLQQAAESDPASIAERHDLEIVCAPTTSESEVLTIATVTLRGLGLKMRRRDGVLSSVSSPLSVRSRR